jgi:hypothetical protein
MKIRQFIKFKFLGQQIIAYLQYFLIFKEIMMIIILKEEEGKPLMLAENDYNEIDSDHSK